MWSRIDRRMKIIIGATLVPLISVLLYFLVAWHAPLKTDNRIYELKSGMTLGQFADLLTEDGILSNRMPLLMLARLTGSGRRIKAGEYRLEEGISTSGILDKLVTGKAVSYVVTFIEGWTFEEMVEALAKAPRLAHEIDGLKPGAIMERLGLQGIHPEGRFYPDSYHYTAGMSDMAILRLAYARMEHEISKAWEARAAQLPYKTPYEALIMASIIEKETGVRDRRDYIASVFVNRLQRGMKLQTDPSVIYGMGVRYKGANIRVRDLRRDTPYNTYTRFGLPPTPIAMPGRAALHAALHPAATEYLYFVARGDGSSYFSSTLAEHERAVRTYQLGGKK